MWNRNFSDFGAFLVCTFHLKDIDHHFRITLHYFVFFTREQIFHDISTIRLYRSVTNWEYPFYFVNFVGDLVDCEPWQPQARCTPGRYDAYPAIRYDYLL